MVLLTILNHPVYSSRFLPFVLRCSSYSSSSSSAFSSSFYNQRCRTCLSLSLPVSVSAFCSSRTHRCGTTIVLKSFHLLAPAPPARESAAQYSCNDRDRRALSLSLFLFPCLLLSFFRSKDPKVARAIVDKSSTPGITPRLGHGLIARANANSLIYDRR